ncbi:MAG: hypothetical protein IJ490_00955 [Chlamydia sp.]|nr:hypothetical protein [Chlamydia sp.]
MFLGTVLAGVGVYGIVGGWGTFTTCLGTLIIAGIVLVAGILFAILNFCLIRGKLEKQIVLMEQDLSDAPYMQEEQALPLIENASCSYEPDIFSPEKVQKEGPLVLQNQHDQASRKYIVIGEKIKELVRVGRFNAKGEKVLEENVNVKLPFVRVWDELFIFGNEGEVIRLDGFCCKILPIETEEESPRQNEETKQH